MNPITDFRNWLSSARTDQPNVHVECRRCGTTLSRDVTVCPCCGSNEITIVSL